MELVDNILCQLEIAADSLVVARDTTDENERGEALREALGIVEQVVEEMGGSERELIQAVLNVHKHTIELHRMAVEGARNGN